MSDLGLTHVALLARGIEESVDFYRRFAGMEVVHRRVDPATGKTVVWLSDRTRPFVLVLIEAASVDHRLGGFAHLGVGCGSAAEVDRRCALARAEGRECVGPIDGGEPVGYFALIADPDGHNLELSHGQEVGLTVTGGDPG
jgi:catechol 2,3-dioxygenase-like lactoylglutathione lyase family enzyme